MTEDLVDTGQDPYSAKYMQIKIKEHFGDRVLMTARGSKDCVVTLRDTASSALHAFHKQCKAENAEDEKQSIVETAAKLIESDVKYMDIAHDFYPEIEYMESEKRALNYIPKSLQVLLRTMFAGKNIDVKLASIGQGIKQAIRLQIGLGVQCTTILRHAS